MGDKLLKTTSRHGDTGDQRTQGLACTAPRDWYELGPGANVQNPYAIPLYWLVYRDPYMCYYNPYITG